MDASGDMRCISQRLVRSWEEV